MMSSPASPAETRAYIIERLVGETGEPQHVIDAARAMAERAVPSALASLNQVLGSPVSIDMKSVELARFADARPQEATNHAMTIAASDSSPDAMIMVMDPEALAIVVSTLFGGDPDLPITPINRDLSPTEVTIAGMVFTKFAEAMNGSGPRAFNIRFPLALPTTGAEMAKQIVRDGPAARVDFTVAVSRSSGQISLFIPQRVLMKHRGDAVATQGTDKGRPADWGIRLGEEVKRSAVMVEATMPLARLTLGEIEGLRPGQVIAINPAAQSGALLAARKKPLFVCEFGKLGQHYTVRVRHPYDAAQEFMEGLLPKVGDWRAR